MARFLVIYPTPKGKEISDALCVNIDVLLAKLVPGAAAISGQRRPHRDAILDSRIAPELAELLEPFPMEWEGQ